MVTDDDIRNVVRSNPYACTYSWTIDWMIDHFKQLPAGANIIELGTFIGATTRRLAQELPHLHIHTIDLNDFENFDNPGLVKGALTHYGLNELTNANMTRLQDMHIGEFANVFRYTGPSTSIHVDNVQGVFVDAGHTYEETMADLNHVWNLVEPGSLIFGDDVDSPFVYNAVAEFSDLKNIPFTIFSKMFKIVKEERQGIPYVARLHFDYQKREKLYEYYYGSPSDRGI